MKGAKLLLQYNIIMFYFLPITFLFLTFPSSTRSFPLNTLQNFKFSSPPRLASKLTPLLSSSHESTLRSTLTSTTLTSTISSESPPPSKGSFSKSLNLLLASLSFSTYTPPSLNTYRSSLSTSGVTTRYLSQRFDREVHGKLLTVEVVKVDGLPNKSPKSGIIEDTLSGGEVRKYGYGRGGGEKEGCVDGRLRNLGRKTIWRQPPHPNFLPSTSTPPPTTPLIS
jgi:hypothetical protein